MARVGRRYEPKHGVSWSDGNSPTDPPRGYYPVRPDGSVDTRTRLRLVDDAPGTDRPDHHFERMPRAAGVGYFHGAHEGEPERIVGLEAHPRGKGKPAGALKRAITRIRLIPTKWTRWR